MIFGSFLAVSQAAVSKKVSARRFSICSTNAMSPCVREVQAEVPVIIHDGEELDNKLQYGIRVVRVNWILFHNLCDVLHCIFLDLLQHLINVCIVQIKGRTIDIDLIYQFFYGNFLILFFCMSRASPSRSCAFVLRTRRSIFSVM